MSEEKPGPPPEPARFDPAPLLKRFQRRPEVLHRMATLFQEESGRLLPEIRQAITRADAAVLRRLAHTLKGAASCFDAGPVVAAALSLEIMGRDNNLAAAEETCNLLERETAGLIRALGVLAG